MRFLFRTGFIFLVLIALSAVGHYVQIPYNIITKGVILPVKEWRLTRLPDGTILNSQKNNLANRISYYSVLEFQRGDHAEFLANEKIFSGKTVRKGDTVGYVRSYEEERRLLGLLTALEEQKGLLQISLSGERQEEINSARQRLVLAEQEYETQKRLMARMQALHKTGVIADEAWDLAQNDYQVKKQNINITRSVVEMLAAGAKPEERELIRTNIRSYQRQIEQTENRIDAFNILTPFSGTIIRDQSHEPGNETIIRVADMERLMVTFPVELYQLAYIQTDTPVNLRVNSSRRSYRARIINIDNTVQFIEQKQRIFVTGVIEENPGMFMPDMLVQAEIVCGEISAWNYIRRLWKVIFEN
jgi:hypothetical protein